MQNSYRPVKDVEDLVVPFSLTEADAYVLGDLLIRANLLKWFFEPVLILVMQYLQVPLLQIVLESVRSKKFPGIFRCRSLYEEEVFIYFILHDCFQVFVFKDGIEEIVEVGDDY